MARPWETALPSICVIGATSPNRELSTEIRLTDWGEVLLACIIVMISEHEIPIVAGPRTGYMDVLVASLNEESIAARIVAIEDTDPLERPNWACTPGDEVYVVVPHDKREAAVELSRWVYRVCLQCETFLMPKVRSCQKCGAPHLMKPGPFLGCA